jgi:hypothetical protein
VLCAICMFCCVALVRVALRDDLVCAVIGSHRRRLPRMCKAATTASIWRPTIRRLASSRQSIRAGSFAIRTVYLRPSAPRYLTPATITMVRFCYMLSCDLFRVMYKCGLHYISTELLANSKFSSVMYSLTSYGISFSTRSIFIVFIVYMYNIFESYVGYALCSGRSCNEEIRALCIPFSSFQVPILPSTELLEFSLCSCKIR